MDFSKIAILNQSLQGPLGSIIGALIILAIGWFVAGIIRRVLAAALAKTKLDSKLSSEAGIQPISGIIADLIYWFILLIVLTMVVGRLGLNGLFTPLTNMIDKIFAFMPNAMLAGFVMFIGFIVAKIVRSMVTTVVSRLNIQALVSKAGVDSKNNLPNIAGSVVFLLTIVPFTIAALDALKVESISRPATNMLNKVMESLPNVFTALAVLVVTFLVVRLVADVIKGLVANTQLDDLPNKIGLQNVLGTKKLSDVIGCGVLVFAMLFAIIAAADLLGFGQISDIVTMFIAFGSQIILGAVILTIGFWLANLIAGVVERSEQGSKFLANIVRVLIMGLVLAMGLKAMGIADSIVNLAFGLTLGAVAVAFALSFGLGGQEAAARYLRRLQDKLEKDSNE
ncbi:mechanosensitive ion channel [Moraxella pluranimalium]|uniref:Small-conductance mechanosensitive channel n=1 Tax=Moraxella pluranimalium TaxID=470453 RepID=A0A1T0CLI7_9GAMM|nr:mechanosensitive ion channel [Moraxella pluranimalium]OOS23206.1 hypothetical protein B0680_07720 [Moraxella pluranimalium]